MSLAMSLFCLSPAYSWFLNLQLLLIKRLCASFLVHLCLSHLTPTLTPKCRCVPLQQILLSSDLMTWLLPGFLAS